MITTTIVVWLGTIMDVVRSNCLGLLEMGREGGEKVREGRTSFLGTEAEESLEVRRACAVTRIAP